MSIRKRQPNWTTDSQNRGSSKSSKPRRQQPASSVRSEPPAQFYAGRRKDSWEISIAGNEVVVIVGMIALSVVTSLWLWLVRPSAPQLGQGSRFGTECSTDRGPCLQAPSRRYRAGAGAQR